MAAYSLQVETTVSCAMYGTIGNGCMYCRKQIAVLALDSVKSRKNDVCREVLVDPTSSNVPDMHQMDASTASSDAGKGTNGNETLWSQIRHNFANALSSECAGVGKFIAKCHRFDRQHEAGTHTKQ